MSGFAGTVEAGSSDNASSTTTDGRYFYAMVGDRDTSTFFSPSGDDAMAIDPATGSIVWINDGLSFVSNPLPALGSLFYGYYWDVLETDSGLTKVDASIGRHEWVNSRLDTPGLEWFTTTPMLVHNGEDYRSSRHPMRADYCHGQ